MKTPRDEVYHIYSVIGGEVDVRVSMVVRIRNLSVTILKATQGFFLNIKFAIGC